MDHGVPPLSPRLQALAEAIAPGSRVADVGSDHGLLSLWLAASGRASYCLATEETEALLRRVRRPPADAPWAHRIAFRSGDGLAAVLPGDRIDTIVLAGLGGRTIVGVLGAAGAFGSLSSRLVLQPRSEHLAVRAWLSENGWRLISERVTLLRSRFHLTLAAERGPDSDLYRDAALSREDLLAAGPLLARRPTPDVLAYWRMERRRLASILAEADGGPSVARARAGLARAERVVAAISRRAG
jgi:tRNA (adenine22-N1)-methyltransferase